MVEGCMQGVSVTLDPLGKHLAPLLAILDDVIQSNLPKRKPKVAKGARDFGPREMTIRKPMFKASLCNSSSAQQGALIRHAMYLESAL